MPSNRRKVMVVLDTDLDEQLRAAAGAKYGFNRGALSKAVADAIHLWLVASDGGTKKYNTPADLID